MCTYNIMLLRIRKKTIWKFTFFQVSCPLSLPLLNIQKRPISITIPVTLLQIVYICMTVLYLHIRVHELPLCSPASCVVVRQNEVYMSSTP